MKIMTKKINLKITIEETVERHPVPVLGTDYKVKIVYKNIKVAELDVEDKIIKISLPNKYKKANNEKILDMAIDKMYEQIAKVEVERAMEILLNNGIKVTEEQLLSLVSIEINNGRSRSELGSTDIKNKFKQEMDEYLKKVQDL